MEFDGSRVECSTNSLSNPLARYTTFVHVCKVTGLYFGGKSYYEASYRVTGKEAGGSSWPSKSIDIKLVNRNVRQTRFRSKRCLNAW